MAKAKFGKLNNSNSNDKTTHADLQINITEPAKKVGRPLGSKVKKEQANASLTVAFTPTQKDDLINFANKDDRTAGYIIKKLLIENGIIQDNK